MNTSQLIAQGIESGKMKMGTCPISSCTSNDNLLYRLNLQKETTYICGSCLDRLEKILPAMEAMKNGK